MQDIPKGWAIARLGDVIPKPRPKIPPDPTSRLPFIGMDHITPNSFHLSGQDEFAKMKSAGSYFQQNDVLYGRLRPYLNKVHTAKFEGVASAEFIVLPASEYFESEFIKYLLHQRKFGDFAMCRSSGDRPRVKFDGISDFEFPLPPLNEQRRIVEKIETLFARLDKGEEAIREVQKLLARHRQSVLKAAVTGQLTADWRAENADRLEHGRDLLARILKTRRETWEGRGKYKEPAEPDTTDLPELPEGWVWASVEQISSAIDYGSSSKCGTEVSGVPVLRMGNIVHGELDFTNLKYLPADHIEFPKLLLEAGDLLFNRTNSAELVGKTAVFKGIPEKCSFASYLIRVRLIGVSPDLISAYINSVFGRAWVKSVVSQQVGQANVNGTKLKALKIPLPPAEEQQEILERMTEHFSKILAVTDWCESELARSAALRQSILKDAFAGRLVPQDPSDEPASELLDRIKSAQVATPKPKRGRARKAVAS